MGHKRGRGERRPRFGCISFDVGLIPSFRLDRTLQGILDKDRMLQLLCETCYWATSK